MESTLVDKRSQSTRVNNAASLIELLVAAVIGALGMMVALLGIYSDNPFLFISGLVVFVIASAGIIATSGKSIIEFVRSILDFKDYLRQRRKNKNNNTTK